MKHILDYTLDGVEFLSNAFRAGIAGYAVRTAEHGRPASIWLFFDDGMVIEIQGRMTTVGDWEEVGTLYFRAIKEDDVYPDAIRLESEWTNIDSIEKLILEEDELLASSGIAIRNNSGNELIIVCGAYPYTIELLAPFYGGDFQPEYKFDIYKREVMVF